MADVEIVPIDCPSCKIIFWVSASFQRRVRESGEGFNCPSGHSMSYKGDSVADKLRKAQDELIEKDRMIRGISDKERELDIRIGRLERRAKKDAKVSMAKQGKHEQGHDEAGVSGVVPKEKVQG